MLQVRFVDNTIHHFTTAERATLTRSAILAEHIIGATIALPDPLQMIIEASNQTLETGDNAYTESPHLIRWWVDPQRGVAEVAEAHLAQALGHEAFHATRFRRLGREASSRSLLDVAIGEGLATAFARDVTGAIETWAAYDPTLIQDWATELIANDVPDADLHTWKFQHPDGREWIAFRVGTWIVDQHTVRTGQRAADLVWTPVGVIAEALLSETRRRR